MKSAIHTADAPSAVRTNISALTTVGGYLRLMKPTIVLLFGVTGLVALIIEGSLNADPSRFALVVVGIILTAGSANALNMYIDRDIDSVMSRTKKKRPIPLGQVSATGALVFGILTGITATALLWIYGSPFATFFGIGTIAFYVGVYTLFLKRRTPYNIVIGGAAGATAPLIGWAAGQNSLNAPLPWLLFALVFFWTPPHFWALSLAIKDDYKEAGVPMLPVVKGVPRTLKEIIVYTWLLGPIALAVGFTGHKIHWIYLGCAALLHGVFIYLAHQLQKSPTDRRAYGVFGYSILYLFFLFIFLVVDHWILK